MATSPEKPAAEKFDCYYKIVLVGDSGVGKSNILSKFHRNIFNEEEKSTIGVEFAARVIEIPNGKRIKAQVWDTAGQERYRSITNVYYRNAAGAILVYDITKQSSFDNCERWLRELRDHSNTDKGILVVLLGNKKDLVDAQPNLRQVSEESAKRFAEENRLHWLETSAKTGENVYKAFEDIVSLVYEAANAAARSGPSTGGAPSATGAPSSPAAAAAPAPAASAPTVTLSTPATDGPQDGKCAC